MTYPNRPQQWSAYPVPPVVIVPQKSAGAAVALEILLGLLGIFGVGNLYAGRTGTGVALLLSFWGLFWVNFFLIFAFIGLVTMPLTWIAYLVMGALLAARAVERHNTIAVAGAQGAIGPAF
ncbi:hypothetical protein [Micromonospora auratinigra]|uniref:TM2 domain n=1 Tax=Micromonospora auratinigra TaxID=261654 RepID=A0A1A8Z9P7_9ACTN|nr:hypothetical protein [Micromonospora auratinigra]SBT40687.1 TM2 domain [Micromonospora auratinigra]